MGGVFSKRRDTFRENRTRNPVYYEKKKIRKERVTPGSWWKPQKRPVPGCRGANGMPGLGEASGVPRVQSAPRAAPWAETWAGADREGSSQMCENDNSAQRLTVPRNKLPFICTERQN